jgi:hypothetical protein
MRFTGSRAYVFLKRVEGRISRKIRGWYWNPTAANGFFQDGAVLIIRG